MSSHWEPYVHRFHAERPGITERVLSRSVGPGATPYGWLLAALPQAARVVLDLACGSAPLQPPLAARGVAWLGVDISAAELATARDLGRAPVALADVAALPLGDRGVDAVVASMALMVVPDPGAALGEVARVLRPGGAFVATLASDRPVPARSLPTLIGLVRRLGTRPGYPGGSNMRELAATAERAGLAVTSDERRPFWCDVRTPAEASELVEALYLPDVAPEREHAAARWLAGRAPLRVPVPIRRLVAVRR